MDIIIERNCKELQLCNKQRESNARPTCRRMALIFDGFRKDFASADWEERRGRGGWIDGGGVEKEIEGQVSKKKNPERSGMELRI